MSTSSTTKWVHLDHKPGSVYRQLFVKGANVAAQTLANNCTRPDEPMSPEDAAEIFQVPVEAVHEAIAYGQSHPPEIELDRKTDDARIQQRLKELPTKPWQYLDRKPGSVYHQLFVRPQNVRARTLYGMYMDEDAPQTIDEIADAYRPRLPVEAVIEALAYSASDPPAWKEDWEMEQASLRRMAAQPDKYPHFRHPAMTHPPVLDE
jgi:uncharacterized protein (DUF433 family)